MVMEMAKVFAIAIHDKYVANCSEEVGILRCRISSSEVSYTANKKS